METQVNQQEPLFRPVDAQTDEIRRVLINKLSYAQEVLNSLLGLSSDVGKNSWNIKTKAQKGVQAMKDVYYLFDRPQ